MSVPAISANKKVKPLRDALYAALITFGTSLIGLSIIYLQARDAQMASVRSELLNLARTTAAQIDGDLHRAIVSKSQAGSPEHLRALAPLVRMHRAAKDVIYVYTCVQDEGRLHWVLDTSYQYRVAIEGTSRRRSLS
jgi:hypothetical protein